MNEPVVELSAAALLFGLSASESVQQIWHDAAIASFCQMYLNKLLKQKTMQKVANGKKFKIFS